MAAEKILLILEWIEDFCMDITMATHYETSVLFCVCHLKIKPNSETLFCRD